MKVGQLVTLNVPENPRLHGKAAVVVRLAPWGAHVRTAAAAAGRFRALHAEMEPAVPFETAGSGYSGDFCVTCGSSRMRRSGACAVCEDCGSSSGCS